MGDRGNIYLVMENDGDTTKGVYLYTHWSGYRWPEALREALAFGKGRWDDAPYLARIITSRVFSDQVDSLTGGGISLFICDNEYPITICDLTRQRVYFSGEEGSVLPIEWTDGKSFAEFVAQESADYPRESADSE